MTDRSTLFRLAVFAAGSLSIASLLAYFFGVAGFGRSASVLLSMEVLGLFALASLGRGLVRREHRDLIVGGLWAGCLATLVYDVVRIPLVHAGLPVFKAISYFGTVLLGIERPTPLSDIVGWTYHLSNGVSFGLMYAALVSRPGAVSAVVWGLSLEGAMLLTPYAEVFGYRRDARFMAITIGSHACYGLTLWLALRAWQRKTLSIARIGATVAATVLGIGVIGADFHRLGAATLPPSPPASLGPDLHVTWDVPEPDRIAAIWALKKFVRPEARFHFVPPFQSLVYGVPFDVPEAEFRRTGSLATTEVLLQHIRRDDPRLDVLGRMAHLSEVTPWMMPSDPEARELTERLRAVAAQQCGERLTASCLPPLLASLDEWYERTTRD
jgi:hypothetical protein